jgi:ABC-type multidrug transport system ATPase subunit
MGVFMLGVLMQITFSVQYIMQILYKPAPLTRALVWILQFWPPFNFARVSSDIATKTPQVIYSSTTSAFVWADLYEEKTVLGDPSYQIPATVISWAWSFMDLGVFLVVSMILYSTLPTEGGWLRTKILVALARRHKHFSSAPGSRTKVSSEIALEALGESAPGVDSDVVDEARAALSPECDAPVRILNIQKVFRKHFYKHSRGDVHAVRGVSLSVKEGEVFALLGHNGAGKTTLLSILNGDLTPSSGDATIYGHSVLGDLGGVRKILGVCPQHDVIWPELTAREHLRLFGELKGVPKEQMEAEIDKRLRDVLLFDVGDNPARKFSGGMKRRLSVTIACMGLPKILFFDEPSTGLDPVSRRQIWAAIQSIKEGRVIILTTHSMEEADALGDRVAIMAQGELRCIGTSLHLKSKYGIGYVLALTTTENKVEALKAYVASALPQAPLMVQTSGQLKFGIASDQIPALASFLQKLEADMAKNPRPSTASRLNLLEAEATKSTDESESLSSCPCIDWGVQQTTLEEVFIRVGASPKSR